MSRRARGPPFGDMRARGFRLGAIQAPSAPTPRALDGAGRLTLRITLPRPKNFFELAEKAETTRDAADKLMYDYGISRCRNPGRKARQD
jgi:hypothetical protein